MRSGSRRLFGPPPLFVVVLCVLSACRGDCPSDGEIFVAGEAYCGTPCAACGDCEAGFSCQFSAGRGVCVDEAFLVDRGVSTACEDPCPRGERRFEDQGTSACVRICTVDGECPECCYEPPDIEIRVCAPRPELCN
jgi:hypothetical protein